MYKEEVKAILKERYNVLYIGRHESLYATYIIGISKYNQRIEKHYYIINKDDIEEVKDKKVLEELKRIYEPKDGNIY